MKKLLAIAIVMWSLPSLCAQTLATQHIGSAGTEASSTQGSITYHIGEMVVADQGRIQAGVIQNIVGLINSSEDEYDLTEVRLYPNPTTGPLQIEHGIDGLEKWFVANSSGQIIQQMNDSGETDLGHLPPGQYYMVPIIQGDLGGALPIQIIR